jgi:hypothetical protein
LVAHLGFEELHQGLKLPEPALRTRAGRTRLRTEGRICPTFDESGQNATGGFRTGQRKNPFGDWLLCFRHRYASARTAILRA